MLLDIVALAGDVGRDDLAARQPHAGGLSLARVGLLRPRDAHLHAHALEHGRFDGGQGGGHGVAGSLGFSAALWVGD